MRTYPLSIAMHNGAPKGAVILEGAANRLLPDEIDDELAELLAGYKLEIESTSLEKGQYHILIDCDLESAPAGLFKAIADLARSF